MTDTKKETEKAIRIGIVVAEYYGMNLFEVFDKSLKRDVTIKRQLVFFLVRKHTVLTFGHIGRAFKAYGPAKDHTTIIHSCTFIQNTIDVDKYFRKEVKEVESEVHKKVLIFKKPDLTEEEKDLLNLKMIVVKACRTSVSTRMLKKQLVNVLL